jgi:hypothetical protein
MMWIAVIENIELAKRREDRSLGSSLFAFYFYFIGFGLILCQFRGVPNV